MRNLDDEHGALIDLIYDAATETELWDQVLLRIADATGSAGALIDGFSYKRRFFAFHHHARLDSELKQVHEAHYASNPWSDVMIRQPAGRLRLSDDIMPLEDLKRTGFYSDILRPQALAHSLMTPLAMQEDFCLAFNLMRGERAGEYGTREISFIGALQPHLRRASELRLRVEGYESLVRAELQVLDILAHGVILLDASAKILFVNKAASQTLSRDDSALRFDGSSAVTAASLAEADRLRALIGDVLEGGPGGIARLSNDAGEWVLASVMPLRGKASVFAKQEGVPGTPAAALFISDSSQRLPASEHVLADHYDLTRAEVQAARVLAEGASIEASASLLGISTNTLKTHARRVYGKLNVRGQADLVSLLASLTLPTLF